MTPLETERKTQIMQRMKKADRERFVAGANAIIASLGAVLSDPAKGILSLDSRNQVGWAATDRYGE